MRNPLSPHYPLNEPLNLWEEAPSNLANNYFKRKKGFDL